MTAKEKLLLEHPRWTEEQFNWAINQKCPDYYNLLSKQIGLCAHHECEKCWNREIPGTEDEEKENENMSEATCDLDYKAEYERLLEENLKLHDMRVKNDRQRELDLIALKEQASIIEKYEFGFRVVEAFLGKKILEDYE